MNTNTIVSLLNEYGGPRDTALDTEHAQQLIMFWTLAGIVVVNSITITLSMVGIMVEDEARKRLSSFYVTPVKRVVFVLGYIIAAFLMGIVMCCLTVMIGEVYIVLTGGILLSVSELLQSFLYIILIVFVSASMVFLIANFTHSMSAFSGVSIITGTLVGFLTAIYIPLGALPQNVQTVLKGLPLLHACSFLRSIFTKRIIADTFVNCPVQVIDNYKEIMGITIYNGTTVLSGTIQLAFLLASGMIFIGIAVLLQRKRNVMSR